MCELGISSWNPHNNSFFKKRFYLFIFREGEGKEKGREASMCGCLLQRAPTGDLAHNPGMCPDWESNRQLFGLQAHTQPTEPYQPGLMTILWEDYPHLSCISGPVYDEVD